MLREGIVGRVMDKNILHLRDDVFVYAGRTYMLDDFYTEEFYHYSNKWVKSHPLHEIYINILYVKVIQNILAIAFFLAVYLLICLALYP